MTPESRLDFGDAAHIREMGLAISRVAESLGWSYPLRIGEREVGTARALQSLDPSSPEQVIATFPMCGAIEIDLALAEAERCEWHRVPRAERAAVLARAAESLRLRRYELAAWICFETGLTWARADEEVAGAIDALTRPATIDSHGACAVLTPSGSPFAAVARLCGETLLAGDPVLLKPARGTPLTAWKLVDALRDAGLPDGALTMIPGHGDEIAPLLLADGRVRQAAFFGSRVAGDRIKAVLAGDRPLRIESRSPLAVRIDPSTDLGELLSRAGGVGPSLRAGPADFEELASRLRARLDSLAMGPSIDLASEIGPLPDAEAFRAAISWSGRSSPRGERGGYFVGPMVRTDLQPGDPALERDRPAHLIALTAATA